ncbi:MAG: (2Fe-2S) ferredoxin domain-containing protein, partial [Deltaproteobacteria bacterium]|nr:(2Fe-2S) ferredoxin domain-containing protein [Deltaproteobacteria bacterium]
MAKLKSVVELEAYRQDLQSGQDPHWPVVRVCLGPGCLAQGADKVARAFKTAIKSKRLKVEVKPLVK